MTHAIKILEEGRNCHRIASCRRAAFFIDGEAYFKALAETLENAKHAVYILGWDFDSRIHLVREKGHPLSEIEFGTFLNSLVQNCSDLHIHILDWDFPCFMPLSGSPYPYSGSECKVTGASISKWTAAIPSVLHNIRKWSLSMISWPLSEGWT